MTIPHVIPYTVADYVGYSNAFTFSADGKIMYAINNPQDPRNLEKSKIVFAAVELEENAFDLDSNKAEYVPPQNGDNTESSKQDTESIASPKPVDTESSAPTADGETVETESRVNYTLIALICVGIFTVISATVLIVLILYFKKKR